MSLKDADKFLANLYLDLLKKSVAGALAHRHLSLHIGREIDDQVIKLLAQYGMMIVKEVSEDDVLRGRSWPVEGISMTGMKRMDNLHECIEDVLENDVPGDFIETGVWRGGACVFMRGILKACGVEDRNVWVADSFEGLPPPDTAKYPADRGSKFHTYDQLRVSVEEVERNFRNYGLLDDRVKFLKGWFKDTLPAAPIGKLSILRLDGDMYESTMDGLVNLYPKLSVGGYCIVDDYGIVTCEKAVNDYREKHGIVEPMHEVDHVCVYWKKTKAAG